MLCLLIFKIRSEFLIAEHQGISLTLLPRILIFFSAVTATGQLHTTHHFSITSWVCCYDTPHSFSGTNLNTLYNRLPLRLSLPILHHSLIYLSTSQSSLCSTLYITLSSPTVVLLPWSWSPLSIVHYTLALHRYFAAAPCLFIPLEL